MIHPSLCEGAAVLIRQEGNERFPYNDRTGKRVRLRDGNLSIGKGINIQDTGLLQTEIDFIFENRIERIRVSLETKYPWFSKLNTVRKWVCINMAYQLGLNGFHGFTNTRKALARAVKLNTADAWKAIKRHMLDSDWARGVHYGRAHELAALMVSGKWCHQ